MPFNPPSPSTGQRKASRAGEEGRRRRGRHWRGKLRPPAALRRQQETRPAPQRLIPQHLAYLAEGWAALLGAFLSSRFSGSYRECPKVSPGGNPWVATAVRRPSIRFAFPAPPLPSGSLAEWKRGSLEAGKMQVFPLLTGKR